MLWLAANAEGPESVAGMASDCSGSRERSEVPKVQRFSEVQKESEVPW